MATFAYQALHIYSATDFSFVATDTDADVASDGDADTTF